MSVKKFSIQKKFQKKTVSTVTVTVVTEKQLQVVTVSEKQLRLTLQLVTVSEKQIRVTLQVVTVTEKQIRLTLQLVTVTEKQLQNRYGRYNSYSRNDPPWSGSYHEQEFIATRSTEDYNL